MGRKPIRDLNLAIGERFQANEKESKYKDQFRFVYSKRMGGRLVCEVEDGKVFFKRVA